MTKKYSLGLSSLLALLAVIYAFFSLSLIPLFFHGDQTHWLAFQVHATAIKATPLNDARQQIFAAKPPAQLTLSLTTPSYANGQLYLTLRLGDYLTGNSSRHIEVAVDHAQKTLNATPAGFGVSALSKRLTLPIQIKNHQAQITLKTATDKQLYLLELGLSQTKPALDGLWQWALDHHNSSIKWLCGLALLAWLIIVSWQRCPTWLSALTLLAIGFCFLLLRTWLSWNPTSSLDFASFTAANPLTTGPGGNLNYGLYMVQSLLQGHGVLLNGHINWARMPGYGFLLLPAALFAPSSTHLLEIALNTAIWQISLYACTAALLFTALNRISKAWLAAIITMILLMQSQPLYYSFIEGLIPSVMLYLLASGCWYLQASQNQQVPAFRYHLALQLGFACWFFLRPDISIAWFVVSLFLYARQRRTWKYLALPFGLFLLIAISWGLYKQPYVGSFSPTTETVGEVFMLGLWQVPNHFGHAVLDKTYFDWVSQHTPFSPTSPEASRYTLKAVFTFYLTHPLYMLTMVLHQLIYFSRQLLRFILILVMLIALCIGYKRKRLLLLGWALPFNLPLYFFTYNSGGRFFFPATASILVSGILCLFERSFYQRIKQQGRLITAIILLLGLSFYAISPTLNRWMLAPDNFRYWTPFSDTSHCLLCQVKSHD